MAAAASVVVTLRRTPKLPLLARPLADGLNLNEHLMAGGVATTVTVHSMHPLDTLKTTQQSAATSGEPLRDFFTLLRTVPCAVYTGVGSALGSKMPAGTIKFAAYKALSATAARHARRIPQPLSDLGCADLAFVSTSCPRSPTSSGCVYR